MDKNLCPCLRHDVERASMTSGAHSPGASAFSNSISIDTLRRSEICFAAVPTTHITPSRRARSVSRTSTLIHTWLGILLTAPGKTSHIPTVATVSIAPLVRAAFSIARISSDAAHRASRRSGMSTAPACPPAPSIEMRALAGAATLVTMPSGTPSRSSTGPCSICNSINAL